MRRHLQPSATAISTRRWRTGLGGWELAARTTRIVSEEEGGLPVVARSQFAVIVSAQIRPTSQVKPVSRSGGGRRNEEDAALLVIHTPRLIIIKRKIV